MSDLAGSFQGRSVLGLTEGEDSESQRAEMATWSDDRRRAAEVPRTPGTRTRRWFSRLRRAGRQAAAGDPRSTRDPSKDLDR
jgi:hypothetical protein